MFLTEKSVSRAVAPLTTSLASALVATALISTPATASSFPGQIVTVAGECPGGYLPFNGEQLDSTRYPELAAVIATNNIANQTNQGPLQILLPNELAYQDGVSALTTNARDVIFNTTEGEGISVEGYNAVGTRDPQQPKTLLSRVNRVANDEVFASNFTPATATGQYIIRTNRGVFDELGNKISEDRAVGQWYKRFIRFNRVNAAGEPLPDNFKKNKAILRIDAAVVGAATPLGIAPKTCISVGGDTEPVIEVGLKYVQTTPLTGTLELFRVDVSGIPKDDLPIETSTNGDLILANLLDPNPGIARPNIRFRLVNENQCRAILGEDANGNILQYPGELVLTGVQVGAIDGSGNFTFGNEFNELVSGQIPFDQAGFNYVTRVDEQALGGFIAADRIDERTLEIEIRNVNTQEYYYRVQAQCGEGAFARNVYFDPRVKSDGKGGDWEH